MNSFIIVLFIIHLSMLSIFMIIIYYIKITHANGRTLQKTKTKNLVCNFTSLELFIQSNFQRTKYKMTNLSQIYKTLLSFPIKLI